MLNINFYSQVCTCGVSDKMKVKKNNKTKQVNSKTALFTIYGLFLILQSCTVQRGIICTGSLKHGSNRQRTLTGEDSRRVVRYQLQSVAGDRDVEHTMHHMKVGLGQRESHGRGFKEQSFGSTTCGLRTERDTKIIFLQLFESDGRRI